MPSATSSRGRVMADRPGRGSGARYRADWESWRVPGGSQADSASWYAGSDAPRGVADGANPRPLPASDWQNNGGTYLHTAHHSSIVRICYHHHPFCGQTGEIIRWLRRQTAESLVIKLQDGLELAIPSWMLDPLACSLMHDAPAPRLTVEALVALRDLLDRQPLLHTAIPATPCVSQPEGTRDAQESSASPSVAGPRALPHPRRVAAAAHRQAPAVSRAPRPTAHRRQPPCLERGV